MNTVRTPMRPFSLLRGSTWVALVAAGAWCIGLLSCKTKEPKIRLPASELTQRTPSSRGSQHTNIVINIASNGTWTVDQIPLKSDSELRRALNQHFTGSTWDSALIRADQNTSYDRVIKTVLMIHEAGYRDVSFTTALGNNSSQEENHWLYFE